VGRSCEVVNSTEERRDKRGIVDAVYSEDEINPVCGTFDCGLVS
jgi:hypothetical protein